MRALDPIAVPLTGTHLIEASAGTGKTFAITTLYLRLVIEAGLRVEEILVVTYTRAATAELRERVRGRLRQAASAMVSGTASTDPDLDAILRARIQAGTQERDAGRLMMALRTFDQAAIYTIHGFCQRTLQDSAFESGIAFDTSFMIDQGPLINEIAMDFWAREVYGAPEPFVRSLAKVTPSTLVELARRAVSNREMPILPARPVLSGDGGDTALRWQSTQARAAELWASEAEELVELVATSSALNRNRYRVKSVRGSWAPALDLMLTGGAGAGALDLKALDKFSQAGLARGCKKDCAPPEHPFFAICDELVEILEEFASRELGLLLDLVGYSREEILARKAQAQVQSFDDLLYQLRDALRGSGRDALAAKIRSRFRAALIDEFQDTDAVQYEVFHGVYDHEQSAEPLSLFLIGDPKQAIYAFRGADVFTYMLARRDAGQDCHTLETNWRSDPGLIRGVNALFEHARDPFIFDGIEFSAVKERPAAQDGLGGALAGTAALELLFVPREGRTGEKGKLISTAIAQGELPRGIAAEISVLLESDATIEGVAVAPGDIAVLCRTNRQAKHVQQALRELGVPSILEGDASVFDSDQAESLGRVLRAISEPGDASAIRAALATPMMGVSGDELYELHDDERAWDRWLQRIRGWQRTWKDEGFIQAFRRMIVEQQLDRRLLELIDGERRLTNLYHLGELLQAEVMASRVGPQALLRWFRLMCTDRAARADAIGDSGQLRLESDADAVKLVTIHKSKGLEYPIVYCPFLWDGALLRMNDAAWIRFHDPTDGDSLKLDLCSEQHAEHKKLAEREALAENLRLLYVALTRAKHRCTVVWGGFNKAGSSPLGYLLHQPSEFSTDPAGLSRVAKHVKGLSDEQMISELEALAASSGGAIGVSYFGSRQGVPFVPPSSAIGALSFRQARRRMTSLGRTSSFTALVASEAAGVHDHDAQTGSEPSERLEASSGETELPRQVPLWEFPGGVRAGQMFHHLLETADFGDPLAESLSSATSESLARFGYESRWTAPVSEALAEILRTPLAGPESSLSLSALPRSQRLVELEFLFPVASDAPMTAALTANALARVFAGRQDSPWPASYADRLRQLEFQPLSGQLRGFVDLVFEHQGRWYVVDYKSNFLGPDAQDYEPARLTTEMAQHHYFLQYSLYLLALHRYLELRLPDYDYERHVGGVYYLFLRGMSPAHPDHCGIFCDRPALSFVEQLAAVIDSVTETEGQP